jgi:hypothetical protein
MYLYEGVFTRTDVIRDDGKIEKAGTYASELKKGDIVQVCTTSGFDWTVMADYIDTGDQSADKNSIGIIKTTPSGKVPNVSANAGTFTATTEADCRQATVEWPDYSVIREFVASNSENAGIPVGWDTGNGQMDSGQTNCPYVSLETSTAGSTCSYMM